MCTHQMTGKDVAESKTGHISEEEEEEEEENEEIKVPWRRRVFSKRKLGDFKMVHEECSKWISEIPSTELVRQAAAEVASAVLAILAAAWKDKKVMSVRLGIRVIRPNFAQWFHKRTIRVLPKHCLARKLLRILMAEMRPADILRCLPPSLLAHTRVNSAAHAGDHNDADKSKVSDDDDDDKEEDEGDEEKELDDNDDAEGDDTD